MDIGSYTLPKSFKDWEMKRVGSPYKLSSREYGLFEAALEIRAPWEINVNNLREVCDLR